jgi:Uma2 family endonuclease
MKIDPAYRPITADEFLAMDFQTDKRFELDNGVIVMMAGGTERHAWVQGNIFTWLRATLKGSTCRPYGPDMAVKVSEIDVRYPDVSIYCDQPPREDVADDIVLSDPRVIIEVLSPSTTTLDQGTKLEEYKLLHSVQTIAFVDPVNELCRTVERSGKGWLDHIFSGQSGIAIPSLNITIPHTEIFARD